MTVSELRVTRPDRTVRCGYLRGSGLPQDGSGAGLLWACDVLRPVCDLLLGPGRPADYGLGLVPHEAEHELVDVQPLREGSAGPRKVIRERSVFRARALRLLADGSECRPQIGLGALFCEQHLDEALELDERGPAGLAQPARQGVAALVGDGVDGSRASSRALARRGRKTVGDELLRLLIDLALGTRPVVAGTAFHLLRELIGGPAAQREMAEQDVRRRGELCGLTHGPDGSIDTPIRSIRAEE